jgi:hypothetical protein
MCLRAQMRRYSVPKLRSKTSMAMQIMTGRCYGSGNPVEWAYRKAKCVATAGTTSEVAIMAVTDDLLKQDRV